MKTKENMSTYQKYDLSPFEPLLQKYVNAGFYSGTKDLLTLTLQGGFEAFTGRATEDWEHQFVITSAAIPELSLPALSGKGKTVQAAVDDFMYYLRQATVFQQ